MAKEIDIAGKLHAATTEGIVADAAQIHYAAGAKSVEDALSELSGDGLPSYGSGFNDMEALLAAMKDSMPILGVSRVTVNGKTGLLLHGRLSRMPNQLDTFALFDSEGIVYSTTYTISSGAGIWGEWSAGGQGSSSDTLLEATVYDTSSVTGKTVETFSSDAVASADSAAVVWKQVNESAGRFWLLLMNGSSETYVASWPSFSKDGRSTFPSSCYNEDDATTSGARTGIFFLFGRKGYSIDGLYFRDPYGTDDKLTQIPLFTEKASQTKDGLMSKEDKAKLDGLDSVVNHGTGDTTFSLTAGVFHVWGEVPSLTLTMDPAPSGRVPEYMFEFQSGSTATVLSLPEEVKFVGNSVVTSNKRYQVSILNGIGLMVCVDTDADEEGEL